MPSASGATTTTTWQPPSGRRNPSSTGPQRQRISGGNFKPSALTRLNPKRPRTHNGRFLALAACMPDYNRLLDTSRWSNIEGPVSTKIVPKQGVNGKAIVITNVDQEKLITRLTEITRLSLPLILQKPSAVQVIRELRAQMTSQPFILNTLALVD